ncbi:MAG: zf-HC2 domain-containing protein [Oscillospiraceae bacterium]|nr:zf-HC2 domain-containing protein [Oscillospiraceae bacterium]
MKNCIEMMELLSAQIDNELSQADSERLQAHLQSCEECSAIMEFYNEISVAASESAAEAPEELCTNVMSQIRSGNVKKTAPSKRNAIVYLKRYLPAVAGLAVILTALPFILTNQPPATTDGVAPVAGESRTLFGADPQMQWNAEDASVSEAAEESASYSASFFDIDDAVMGNYAQFPTAPPEAPGGRSEPVAVDLAPPPMDRSAPPISDPEPADHAGGAGDAAHTDAPIDTGEAHHRAESEIVGTEPVGGQHDMADRQAVEDTQYAGSDEAAQGIAPQNEEEAISVGAFTDDLSLGDEAAEAVETEPRGEPAGIIAPAPPAFLTIPPDGTGISPEGLDGLVEFNALISGASMIIEIRGSFPEALSAHPSEFLGDWIVWERLFKLPQAEARELLEVLLTHEDITINLGSDPSAHYAVILYKPQ